MAWSFCEFGLDLVKHRFERQFEGAREYYRRQCSRRLVVRDTKRPCGTLAGRSFSRLAPALRQASCR